MAALTSEFAQESSEPFLRHETPDAAATLSSSYGAGYQADDDEAQNLVIQSAEESNSATPSDGNVQQVQEQLRLVAPSISHDATSPFLVAPLLHAAQAALDFVEPEQDIFENRRVTQAAPSVSVAGVVMALQPPVWTAASANEASIADQRLADGVWRDGFDPFDTSALRRFLVSLLRVRTTEQFRILRTNRARRLLGQLRRYAIVGLCFAALSCLVGVWLLTRGVVALCQSRGDQCQGHLRDWLVVFTWAQCAGPASLPAVLIFEKAFARPRFLIRLLKLWLTSVSVLLSWCIWAVMSESVPPACSAFRSIKAEILALQIISALLLLVAWMYAVAAGPAIARIKEVLARRSFVAEAMDLIEEVPACDVPASEECVICLGCVEDDEDDSDEQEEASPCDAAQNGEVGCDDGSTRPHESGGVLHLHRDEELLNLPVSGFCVEMSSLSEAKARPKWCRLPCSHKFHEQCLLEWLRKAKRCPICRAHVRKGQRPQAAQAARAAPSADAPVGVVAADSMPGGRVARLEVGGNFVGYAIVEPAIFRVDDRLVDEVDESDIAAALAAELLAAEEEQE